MRLIRYPHHLLHPYQKTK
jgi:hypothetical protein